MLGRGAALAMNKVIWSAYIAGVADGLLVIGKEESVWWCEHGTFHRFANQGTHRVCEADRSGRRAFGATPAVLVVPTELEIYANQLANDPEIRMTGDGTNTVYSVRNPHTGRSALRQASI